MLRDFEYSLKDGKNNDITERINKPALIVMVHLTSTVIRVLRHLIVKN